MQEYQNRMDVKTYKDALLRKRDEILGTGGIKPLQASMENNTRQGDMADQASGNNEVHIALKLKATDAKILTAIEDKFDVYIPMDGSFQDAKDVQGLIDAIAVHIIKEKEKEKKANG